MGQYKEILSAMVSISNYSKLINEVAIDIAEKLSHIESNKIKRFGNY